MKRMTAFSVRVAKETLRDPVTLIFGVGLPVALLMLMSIIQRSAPVEIFAISRLAPGMAAFSLAFVAMFAAILLAKDKSTSFLLRVFASPMRPWEYIMGYALPMLPIGAAQCLICFIAALFFGLPFSGRLFLALIALLPAAAVYIAFGLLFGVVLTDKQAAPVSSILVQCAALLGGIWFDPALIGGAFETVCKALPFLHVSGAAASAIAGDGAALMHHVLWLIGWAAVLFAAAVFLFKKKMKDN